MEIEALQDEVRRIWTSDTYADKFNRARALGLRHIDCTHATLHISKAAGKIASIVEPADHGGNIDKLALAQALADLLICSARLANEAPEGPIDLSASTMTRLAEIEIRQTQEQHQS